MFLTKLQLQVLKSDRLWIERGQNHQREEKERFADGPWGLCRASRTMVDEALTACLTQTGVNCLCNKHRRIQ